MGLRICLTLAILTAALFAIVTPNRTDFPDWFIEAVKLALAAALIAAVWSA
jgi:hypothetical protein